MPAASPVSQELPRGTRLINFLERHGLMRVGSGKEEKEKQKPDEISVKGLAR